VLDPSPISVQTAMEKKEHTQGLILRGRYAQGILKLEFLSSEKVPDIEPVHQQQPNKDFDFVSTLRVNTVGISLDAPVKCLS
jgi:hypothetical protein